MDSILGMELPLLAKLVVAFVVVMGLIGLATWVFRKFGGDRLGVSQARGRQPRLAVIDAAPVDGRRRLVLIRRDNVEHLVMIGGPTDVVIEQNIVRAVPVAQTRDAPMPRGEMDAPPPRREPAARPEALRGPPPDMAPPPRAPRSDLGSRPPRNLEPRRAEPPRDQMRETPREPTRELGRPMRPPPAAAFNEPEPPVEVHPAPPTADTNLSDMAHRLEAALRRPSAGREASPFGEAPAAREARAGAPARPPFSMQPAAPIVPDPGSSPAAATKPSASAPAASPPAAAAPATPEAKPARPDGKPAPQASVFDSLEEEMASLLGKPEKKD